MHAGEQIPRTPSVPQQSCGVLNQKILNKIGLSYFGASFGYVLALLIPIVKLFAIILWMGIINNINVVHIYHDFFNIAMTPFGRSDAFIGGIILFLFIWIYWFVKEYKVNKEALENGLINK